MTNWKYRALAIAACMATAAIAPSAHASAITADFFTLGPNDPDVNHDIPGVVTGLVQSQLGPDGLPVASALALTGYAFGSSNHISDVDSVTDEIQWWSAPTASLGPQGVVVNLPYDQVLYPNGSNDGDDGYTTAHLSGTFDLLSAGTITMSLGSDDDAWVFINGTLVDDNGGVHGFSDVPFDVTAGLNVGVNTLDIFFADRHTTGSELAFDADVEITPTQPGGPVPEPMTLALFGAGLAGAVAMRRRRR